VIRFAHLGVLIVVLLWLSSVIWAVTDIFRAKGLRKSDRISWCIAAVVLPVVGATSWAIMRRRRLRKEQSVR